MKATEILNSITDMLNLSTEVKLEEMKSKTKRTQCNVWRREETTKKDQ